MPVLRTLNGISNKHSFDFTKKVGDIKKGFLITIYTLSNSSISLKEQKHKAYVSESTPAAKECCIERLYIIVPLITKQRGKPD